MDDNEGRRPSRVPAGTFGGSSSPPPPPKPAGQGASVPPVFDRKRFVNTLVGEGALADADAEELEALERKQNEASTLVGHPPTPAAQTLPGASAPVLAPPKWRGARPYLEGEDPQPRVSSIPAPPPTPEPDKPVGVVIGALRSKVTTKLGLPSPPAIPPGQRLVAAIEAPPDPEIDDTIQQMLEGQASVPMQVEEPAEAPSVPELPLDELGIEELKSEPNFPGASARRVEQIPVMPATPPLLRVPEPPAPSAPLAELVPRTSGRPAEPAQVAPAQPPQVQQAAPAPREERRRTPDAQPAPRAAAPAEPKSAAAPAAVKRAQSSRSPASSLAPAEVSRRVQRDDRNAGYGIVFVAIKTLVGGRGWLLTRGGYRNAPHPPAAAVAAPNAPSPAAPSDLAPPPATDAVPAAPPGAVPAPGAKPAASTEARDSERRSSAHRARDEQAPGVEPAAEPEQEQGDEVAAQEPAVLTVKPRTEPGANLPDIPSREAVIAALEPLRKALTECVHGQRGVAQLDITVSGTGFVSHAVVAGDFSGTPEGSCIARAARTAEFTPFKKPRFRVIYPFSL